MFSQAGNVRADFSATAGPVSVPANFAEGFKKAGLSDKLRFYNIAQGSLENADVI
jgi:four helix bundle protein